MNLLSFWNLFKHAAMSTRTNDRRVRRSRPSSDHPAEIEMLEPRKMLTVTFHGGAVLSHVEAQSVYLGSDWNTATAPALEKGLLDSYLSTLVSGQYMDMLTLGGYTNIGRGTASTGYTDPISRSKNVGINDSTIQHELQNLIAESKVQAPDVSRLYVIYVEPGLMVVNGVNTSHTGPQGGPNPFDGYHGSFAGVNANGASVDIHYAVIAYPGGPNASSSSQGFSSDLNDLTAVASHEVTEAVTDTNANYKTLGWYDNQANAEIGDLANTSYVNFKGWWVQEEVNANDLIINPNDVISSPQNAKATVTSTSAVTISWNAVSGALGYKIFWADMTTHQVPQVLATLGSTATSYSIKNLIHGHKYLFSIEAFRNNTVATTSANYVTV